MTLRRNKDFALIWGEAGEYSNIIYGSSVVEDETVPLGDCVIETWERIT